MTTERDLEGLFADFVDATYDLWGGNPNRTAAFLTGVGADAGIVKLFVEEFHQDKARTSGNTGTQDPQYLNDSGG